MIELKNNKVTSLGGNKYALDSCLAPIQFKSGGKWQDIKPVLVPDRNGWHTEGTPYYFELLRNGQRTIYPDLSDRSKYLCIPSPQIARSLTRNVSADRIAHASQKYDVHYELGNTAVYFKVLLKEPVSFDRITLDVDAVGMDVPELLKSKSGVGIPRPRLIDKRTRRERLLEWSYSHGKLELGFDLTGMEFPVLLKNATLDDQVGASGDDWDTIGASFNSTDAGLVFPFDEDAWDWADVGMRFDASAIGNGDTIDTAYLSLKCNVWGGAANSGDVQIFCCDEANPAAPTTAEGHNGLARTTAHVDITLPAADYDAWYLSGTELKTVVQELATSYDIGNIIFLIDADTGGATYAHGCYTYDNASADAPKLHIEYTSGAGGLSIPVAMHHYNQMWRN